MVWNKFDNAQKDHSAASVGAAMPLWYSVLRGSQETAQGERRQGASFSQTSQVSEMGTSPYLGNKHIQRQA